MLTWLTKPPKHRCLSYTEWCARKSNMYKLPQRLHPDYDTRKNFYETVLVPLKHMGQNKFEEWTYSEEYVHALEHDVDNLRALLNLTKE